MVSGPLPGDNQVEQPQPGVDALHLLPMNTDRLTAKRALGNGYNDHPLIEAYMLAICIAYLLLLAGAQGQSPSAIRIKRIVKQTLTLTAYRAGQLAGQNWRLSIPDMLAFVQTVISVAFATSVAMLVSSFGVTSIHQCRVAIRMCIGYYGAGKLTL
jgi:hypothetical protein